MDTGVARIMNDNFICIKVDREERPDIDNIYMNACQLLSGGGGWPLNAFALPDGKPFFAGTYYSRNSWIKLLLQITQAYKEKNDLVVKQADELTKGIAKEELSFLQTDNVAINKAGYQNLFDSIYKQTDTRNGGLKGSPKFPMPAVTEFLLQYNYITGSKQALDAATTTLTRMTLGGMYDQLGGGFARYSTDTLWRIPHFEKMLYDNAQLVSVYAHAYQLTQNNYFKNILTETISFIERDLAAPGGGFYCSLDADTKGGEGEFYAWSAADFNKAAGSEWQSSLAEYFHITPEGNWEKGSNILYTSGTPEEFSIVKKQSPENFKSALSTVKSRLLAERNKRNKPAADTKILTAWNAMMIKAYTDAYAATGNENYLSKALSNAGFLAKNMIGKDGSMKRNYKDGKTSIDAFLDDYAWTAKAFTRLYQVCLDKHWLELARQVTDHAIADLYDDHAGMFGYTAEGVSDLAIRNIEIADNAIPSPNAIMAGVLYDLGVYFDNKDYTDKSAKMFSAVSGRVSQMPVYYAQWCSLAGLFSQGTYEVAVTGKDACKRNEELQRNYLPTCVTMGGTDKENLPLLADKLQEGKTLIYVCTNKTCKMPVEQVPDALMQIRSAMERRMN